MAIFIRGRSLISIPWKKSQMDQEQKLTNDYFYPRTECNQYSVENVTDEQKQKHTNDYFYPRTECNQYSVENVTDEQRTETHQWLFLSEDGV